MDTKKVAVIVTVYNESSSILNFLDALKKQTFFPREVILVDGGSTDNTLEIAKKFSSTWKTLKIYKQTGNRSVGRNFAIAHTQCPIVAITDAGCLPKPNWLAEIIKPFSLPDTNVVSGYYEGQWQNIFQKCLIPFVLVMPDKAEKSEFYPSTRSMALRRSAWLASGGFDTKLSHNEDYAFAHKLKLLGYNFVFAKHAVVSWIPRKSLKQAAWMFMRFAIGDIQAGILRPQVKKLAFRFMGFMFLFFLSLQLPILLPIIPILILTYIFISILKNFRYVKNIRALYWLPIIQLTADLSIIFGTVVGFLSRAYNL
jgi:glycosyltransferase involved in cell wall biosynthesis